MSVLSNILEAMLGPQSVTWALLSRTRLHSMLRPCVPFTHPREINYHRYLQEPQIVISLFQFVCVHFCTPKTLKKQQTKYANVWVSA